MASQNEAGVCAPASAPIFFYSFPCCTAVTSYLESLYIASPVTDMHDKLMDLTKILQDATEAIDAKYFLFSVHGSQTPIFRERVYCYELYHQMRHACEPILGLSDYCLTAEVDKRGHPDQAVQALKLGVPDFLIHVPGKSLNYAAMEVKPAGAPEKQETKDIKSLEKLQKLGYERLIYLIYGELMTSQLRRLRIGIGKLPIEVWNHQSPGQAAKKLDLPDVVPIQGR